MSVEPISREKSTPLYLQIAKDLRTKIHEGEITDDEALPSERDLTTLTGASRVTIRKAIDKLIDEGLLYRKQGSGTYVSPRIQTPSSFLSSFTDDALTRGDEPDVIWIVKSYSNPTKSHIQIPFKSPILIPVKSTIAMLR